MYLYFSRTNLSNYAISLECPKNLNQINKINCFLNKNVFTFIHLYIKYLKTPE